MNDRQRRDSEEIAGIRAAVRALCAKFPGEYWRKLDRERAYPTEFVAALTEAGFLAALIPEEYGGSGLTMSSAVAIMEEIHAAGCNGAACHAQMYMMGTVLRHGNADAEAALSAEDRDRRVAAAGLRRHRADLRHRHARAAHHGGARRQRQLRRQRAEDLDLARRAFRPDAAAGAHHAARAVKTRPEMALIYRWNADINPLHADPAIATKAGFPRPILHGLATFGVAGHAILKTMCGYDPARFKSIAGRFSSPVFPGETIRTEMWRDGPVVSFRARLVERDVDRAQQRPQPRSR